LVKRNSTGLTRLDICSYFVLMTAPTTTDLAHAILAAPAWARVDLTAPKESLRDAAAQELAIQIGKLIGLEAEAPDPRQIRLPL
jgi:hypothetical protein